MEGENVAAAVINHVEIAPIAKRFKSNNVKSGVTDNFNINANIYQVSSLVNSSSKMAADYTMNKRVQNLANNHLDLHAELVVCHLTGKALINYVLLKGGLWNLKKAFTTANFQALLIQVYKELEKNQKHGLNRELQFLIAEFNDNLSNQNTHVEDSVWHLRIKFTNQPNVESEKKKYLQAETTNSRNGFTKYPCPQFDHHDIKFPITQSTFQHRPMTCADLSGSQFLDDAPPRQMNFMASILFFFMRAMTENTQKKKWHIVFTFGMYLLSSSTGMFSRFSSNNKSQNSFDQLLLPSLVSLNNRDNSNVTGIKWYKHDIIGKCGVALANFQVDLSVVLYCLQQLPQYERYPSCKLMTCLYFQKTFAAYNQIKKEQTMFVKIYNGAPHKSYIWQTAVTIHFRARIKQAENLLAIILLHKKFHQKCTICVAYPRPVIRRALKKLQSLKRLCYTVLASSQAVGSFVHTVENSWLCIVDTFILAFDNSENCHWVAKKDRIKKLTKDLHQNPKEEYQTVQYVLPLVNKTNTLDQYQKFITNIANYNVSVSCMAHNTTNADFYFSQYLLLRSLKCQFAESLRLLNLAQVEYKKSTNGLHYRMPLVSLLVQVELGGFNHPTLTATPNTTKNQQNLDIGENIFAFRESIDKAQAKAEATTEEIPFNVKNLLKIGESCGVPDILRFGLDAAKLFINR